MAYNDPLMLYTRSVVNDYYDFEGKRVRPYPTKERLKKGVPNSEVNDFLRQFVGFLMEDNGFLHIDTQLYFAFPKLTQGQIGEKLVELGLRAEPKNANSVKAIINIDRQKMREYFPQDMISRLVDYGGPVLLIHQEGLENARSSLKVNRLWSRLAIRLPAGTTQGAVGSERFMEFFQTIAPYSKSQMKFVEENIDAEVVGYARRILAGGKLTKEEQKHRELLLGLLGS